MAYIWTVSYYEYACIIVYIIFIACMFFINQFLLVQLTICKLLIISLDSLDIFDTKYYVRVSISANFLLDPVISQILAKFYYCLIMHICESAFDE